MIVSSASSAPAYPSAPVVWYSSVETYCVVEFSFDDNDRLINTFSLILINMDCVSEIS